MWNLNEVQVSDFKPLKSPNVYSASCRKGVSCAIRLHLRLYIEEKVGGFAMLRRLIDLSCSERKPYSEARALLGSQSILATWPRRFFASNVGVLLPTGSISKSSPWGRLWPMEIPKSLKPLGLFGSSQGSHCCTGASGASDTTLRSGLDEGAAGRVDRGFADAALRGSHLWGERRCFFAEFQAVKMGTRHMDCMDRHCKSEDMRDPRNWTLWVCSIVSVRQRNSQINVWEGFVIWEVCLWHRIDVLLVLQFCQGGWCGEWNMLLAQSW